MNRLKLRWLGCVLGIVGLAGCGSSISAPTAYERWNAKDGTFSMDYPADWKAEGGGKQGVQWAEFSQGNARISVSVDVSSSLVGDIAGSAAGGFTDGLGGEIPEELAPVAAAHEFNKESTTADFSGYSEGKPIPFKSPLGEGRKSPFKAKGTLGMKMRGYRATVLAHSKGVKVICMCPDNAWDKLSPAFDKILEGMAVGTASL